MKPITQENDRLGFVGVGYMGRPIARRLLESGFKLTAYDRDHSKTEELIQYGGTVAQSVSELSSSCNVVLSCRTAPGEYVNRGIRRVMRLRLPVRGESGRQPQRSSVVS